MTTYRFQTDEFGVSDSGLHFLRSGFNYRTIAFQDIKRIQFVKVKELHNWWAIFIIGASLIGFGVYLSIGTIKFLIEGNASPRHARMILLLLIPVAGGYFVYNSLQTGLVMKFTVLTVTRTCFP